MHAVEDGAEEKKSTRSKCWCRRTIVGLRTFTTMCKNCQDVTGVGLNQ